MTGAHIAHDCIVGNNVIMANQATLGGHVVIENNAVIGGLSAIHQFCRIGELSMIGGMSAVENDVFPFALAIGNRAKISGLNIIGLKRADYKKSDIQSVNNFIKNIFSSNESVQTEIGNIKNNGNILIDKISKFISVKSSRGLCRYEKK
jgi:UDP-N-acetylglucosamine acyltransferase